MIITVVALAPGTALAQRDVSFPPAKGKPPPPRKSPPRQQSSGEDTGIIPSYGPTMRKTQERTPPPPTTLTVMHKLKYGRTLTYTYADGTVQEFEQWKSYPNDGHRLINFATKRLGDQVIYEYTTKPLASEKGFDPVDIPLLYMAGDYEFKLSDSEVKNLRQYLRDGGTILFNAARGREAFSRATVREMRRVFPNKAFMRVSLDHPLFNCRYRINDVRAMAQGSQLTRSPEVYSIDIGTRAAAILVPWGMGAAWSGKDYHAAGKHLIGESAIRLGVNIVAYTLGGTEYARFLAQDFPVYRGQTRPGDVVRFALAKYRGAWHVNPALQNSLMQTLHANTNIGVSYKPNFVELDAPRLGEFPLVVMTGHYDFRLTSAEVQNLREYLRRGGLLFASAAAGLKPFDIAFRREMRRVLPDQKLVELPPSHPIFSQSWLPIDEVQYTPMVKQESPTLDQPRFFGIFVDDRLAVVYTPYDLFSGVNRESNVYAKGVVAEDAQKLSVNVITYGMSH